MALLIDGVSRRFPVTAVAGSAFQFPDPLFQQLELLARASRRQIIDGERITLAEHPFMTEIVSGLSEGNAVRRQGRS